MAILNLENGIVYNKLEDISNQLKPLNIELNRWQVGKSDRSLQLLTKDVLNEVEKEEILQQLDRYFEELKSQAGYQARDLIVIHPELPNLDTLLAKFERCHTHADDEVRYIIDGEGVFGFVLPDGSQVELTVQAEEYINVPAGTEHWFHLTASKRVKAIRYFTSTEGWVPEYTGTPIRFPLALVAS
jgi:1,2-dihydroxy-3-keto-5-methylthiopentene dioxygenase